MAAELQKLSHARTPLGWDRADADASYVLRRIKDGRYFTGKRETAWSMTGAKFFLTANSAAAALARVRGFYLLRVEAVEQL